LTPNGKIDRRALPAPEMPHTAAVADVVAPRDALEAELVQLWQELLDVAPIGIHQDFFALGGHSLLAVRLRTRLMRLTGRTLPLTTLFQSPTIAELAAALRDPTAPPSSPSLVRLQAGDATRAPLFLVHPVGGSALPYRALAAALDAGQPCWGLQARGLSGLTPHTSIETMARDYVEELRIVQPHGPYHLGGWSAGGVIAFAMAQLLRAQGEAVALVALIDSRANSPYADEPDDAQLLLDIAAELNGVTSAEQLRALPAAERAGFVLAAAERVGLVPRGFSLDDGQRLFDCFKQTMLAVQRYTPAPIDVPLTLLRATEQPPASAPDLGWSPLTTRALDRRDVPGDHESVIRAPHVAALAVELTSLLPRAQGNRP
jgi:thioesterase domain-containing protein